MKWYKIEISCETEAVDILTYLLEEAGIEGAVIEDPNDVMFTSRYKGDWDYSEEAARSYNHSDVIVRVFIEADQSIDSWVNKIEDMLLNIKSNGLDIGSGKIIHEIVDDELWKDKWKEYFKPFKIGNRIVIKPSWEDYQSQNDEIVIEMDPGSAFGSGTHETTSMCVKLLEKHLTSKDLVYDIGCGTGILGLVAALLGAESVVGVDIAEEAIIASEENAKKNGLDNKFDARLGNLTDVLSEKADMIVANIMADIIMNMNETIKDYIKVGGHYITSGIIEGRQNDVIESLKKYGFEIVEHMNEGEWHALFARYKG